MLFKKNVMLGETCTSLGQIQNMILTIKIRIRGGQQTKEKNMHR